MFRSAAGSRPRPSPLVAAFAIAVILCGLMVASLLVGGGDVGVGRSLAFLLGDTGARADEHLAMVVTQLRFPRTIVAIITGISLGIAGCVLQTVTRNPLAETGLLGVNAGAALAVVAGISLLAADTAPALLGLALCGALAASAVVLLVASGAKLSPLRLVLAGVALSATFRGATSYLLMSDGAAYDRYRFWVLGSLSGVDLVQVYWVLPAVAGGLLLVLLLIRPLAALSLGDDIAAGLGHRPRRTRILAAAAVTLLTGASVALCGPIAFLGLLAPHLARSLTGPNLARQLLLSGVFGAGIMIAADVAARVVIAPYEAPVSVLLAVIGGPVLILIVRSRRILTLRVPGGAA
ncbi:FecCD family ABC transporter permease [Stackebrandtia nassauensis]|uniref:Transport system permease protein n=1 Tax=Stackebrandtia nassauensis (strain DSM 44728 / CIP 108903 / NRRL B-16338 / NBRC 102104 / LLR-40K-21) TaxID=446470 RepID=D3Q5A7_STANL|nr:iron chelate uptake ABC transporter family permease subunit [Stackebrandtia nassauensis]ADD44156.1 transport system permease protein [Stackebrandtia nassauensis DSM 44728]